ncbi:3-deoxy-7-phosphoheptulonate synthase [Marinobacter daepoensis]|uniref:Phospho-2-dehydro-3-deoxyheptonate aldolase n=1 Tax=Marinobacter daepoensis TaxID=262077 RepID=A0ABS3BER4_9GAMM|nr:3-deoxy-7-phosphoheptulonate synthase [Marinobacter daepoensis]MBN7770333.1 3-deoxy-7-phosphoheptulonate synthase [Marinobacter daepoensis]MBY6033863.1 3-deoxy-7-phosphoheptulonate synthase [Marinobacter daepoensis]MBY6079779.1 3-deoxy-7-phosphoheptulonate synthase [Marinobacter daepoensis]
MNMPLKSETLDAQPSSACQHRQEARLPTAAELRQQFPADERLVRAIAGYRDQIRAVLHGQDDRTLIVMGPCSIHDEQAALDYATRLKSLADDVSDRFLIVMRAYLEKPRTTVGWKGMLYDPERTGDGNLKLGLERSRRLLLALSELGLPLATEALSPFMMDYLGDLVSWTAIGARTTESQIHREMVSGLPMPTGFKNGTDGGIAVAANAMKSAAHPHHHMGISHGGAPAMISTAGNPDTHLVLRGGRGVTNYDELSIAKAIADLEKASVSTAVMVDCSHDNACKQAERQVVIAQEVMAQKRNGNSSIKGLMLESFLEFGRQDDGADLIYGCSITDPCLGWEQTEALIRSL